MNSLVARNLDLLLAFLALLALVAAECAIAATLGVDSAVSLGIKDAMLVVLGVFGTLLTRAGVNVSSEETNVQTKDGKT